jgi:hypothetical protein
MVVEGTGTVVGMVAGTGMVVEVAPEGLVQVRVL